MTLDAATVLRVGGWDPRYVRVLFVRELGDRALALLDADSDLNVEAYEVGEGGGWRDAGGASANDHGPGMSGGLAYHYGRGEPGSVVLVDYVEATHRVIADDNWWWAFVAPFVEDADLPSVRPA